MKSEKGKEVIPELILKVWTRTDQMKQLEEGDGKNKILFRVIAFSFTYSVHGKKVRDEGTWLAQ